MAGNQRFRQAVPRSLPEAEAGAPAVLFLISDTGGGHRSAAEAHVAVPTAQAGARFGAARRGATYTDAGLPAAVGRSVSSMLRIIGELVAGPGALALLRDGSRAVASPVPR